MFNQYQAKNFPKFCSTSKPSLAAPNYDAFLVEYTSFNTMNCLDTLACNSKIDGLLVYFGNQISIMSHLERQRVVKILKLLGLTSHSLQYYVFTADATNVVQNFASWLLFSPTSYPIPVRLDDGKPINK